MDYRIERMDAFTIVGYKIRTTNRLMKGMRDCPKFWKQIIREKKNEALALQIMRPPLGLMGVSVYNVDNTDRRLFDYYIGVAADTDIAGLESYNVPAVTWAVFPCTLKTMKKTQVNIVNTWSKAASYELLNTGYRSGKMNTCAPDLEVYGMADTVEIWVPVKEK